MIEHASSVTRWDERIARARTLIFDHEAAAEPLAFYGALATYQKSVDTGPRGELPPDGTFVGAIDVDRVVDSIPAFVSWLPSAAPARLTESAAALRTRDRRTWAAEVHAYFDSAGENADADRAALFVVEAVMQPFAETIAGALSLPPDRNSVPPSRCPACGTLPVVAVLREAGHGAKRSLVCGLCFTEWECLRMRCVSCGEEQFDQLPIYNADQFAHARIDACDHCRRYIKTIDMTKNGLAVPHVDDIATLSLDLWATAQGYRRVKANILGF